MAKNDMHVVIFKILSYLYDCMKNGEEPDSNVIEHDALGIPRKYWLQIMKELTYRGYVDGIEVKQTTADYYVSYSDPRVTMDGVEFLMENSMMNKAARFVADAGGFFASIVTPFI